MSFLTKLLAPKQTQPKMVSKAEHEAALAKRQIVIDNLKGASDHNYKCWNDALKKLEIERDTVVSLVLQKRVLKEALTTARAEADANKVELARWRQYGQMRDPATGRLIPRVKAEVA